jgi:hypothetical protein
VGYPREEPGAGNPPARICEGEAEWPSYSTRISKFGLFAGPMIGSSAGQKVEGQGQHTDSRMSPSLQFGAKRFASFRGIAPPAHHGRRFFLA